MFFSYLEKWKQMKRNWIQYQTIFVAKWYAFFFWKREKQEMAKRTKSIFINEWAISVKLLMDIFSLPVDAKRESNKYWCFEGKIK